MHIVDMEADLEADSRQQKILAVHHDLYIAPLEIAMIACSLEAEYRSSKQLSFKTDSAFEHWISQQRS